MVIDLYKRIFLKKCINFLAFIQTINFFSYKKENFPIYNIFLFAEKKYQKNTVRFIFSNYFKGKNSAKRIILNIEKRRNFSNIKYKKNIKNIINKNKFV